MRRKKVTLRKIRRQCECGSDPSPCFAQEDVSGGSVWLEVDDRLGFTCIRSLIRSFGWASRLMETLLSLLSRQPTARCVCVRMNTHASNCLCAERDEPSFSLSLVPPRSLEGKNRGVKNIGETNTTVLHTSERLQLERVCF